MKRLAFVAATWPQHAEAVAPRTPTPPSSATPATPAPVGAANADTCSNGSTKRPSCRCMRTDSARCRSKEKTLIWHLYQAALAGRDIFYDQRYAHNLEMRDVLEAILTHPAGVDRATLDEIERYTKLFWINTGPYNNLTARKFVLTCTPDAFAAAAHAAERAGARFPLRPAARRSTRCSRGCAPMFFDADFDPTVTSKTPPPGKDILTASANNLYVGVTMKDLEGFHEQHPLNSRLVKANGTLTEEVYRVGGRYSGQISAIVGHLEAAIPFATEPMAKALRALITFYQTGETKPTARRTTSRGCRTRRRRSTPSTGSSRCISTRAASRARGKRWCSTSTARRRRRSRRSRRTRSGSRTACRGIRSTARRACTASPPTPSTSSSRPAIRGPITPVGINLPNDQAIREQYGSKSVSLSNVNEAYDKSTLPEFRNEFSWTPEEAARATKWSAFAGELTTNMHEVIGHGSGKVAERLNGNPQAALKEQFSALEEARADLVALYFLPDPKLVELGLVSKSDHADRARRVRGYTRNALVQLRRVREGHADRRRPHAQSPDDRPLADGEHEGDRGAPARRQDVLRDDRSGGVPRRRRPAARRGAADQGARATIPRRSSCSRPTACISTRRCATRSWRASTGCICRPTPAS